MQRTHDVTDLGLRFKTHEKISGYGLIKRRGRGGYAEVWEAESPGGYRVALKLVPLSTDLRSGELRALMITRSIRHPSLLEIYGTWQVDNLLVICMELADGSLWDRFVEADFQGLRGVPRAELLGYLELVADAVDYLNEYKHSVAGRDGVGVQHRDLKPQNILLIGGRPKVADFGLARVMEQAVASHTGHCTLPYAAPENFVGKTSRQSDQYALAVTYCQLRGGWMPFQGSLAQITFGHLYNSPDLSGLPPLERPIVARALAKKPEERWADCRAFIDALQKLGAEAGDSVPDRLYREETGPSSDGAGATPPAVPSDSHLNPSDTDFIPIDGSTDTMTVPTQPGSPLAWDSASIEEASSDFIPIDQSGEFGSVFFEHRLAASSWDSIDETASSDFIPIDPSGEIRAVQADLGWPTSTGATSNLVPGTSSWGPRTAALVRSLASDHAGRVARQISVLRPKLARAASRTAALSANGTAALVRRIGPFAQRARRDADRLGIWLRPRLVQLGRDARTLSRHAAQRSAHSAQTIGRRLRGDATRLNGFVRPRLVQAAGRAATLTRSGTGAVVRSTRTLAAQVRNSPGSAAATAWTRRQLAGPWPPKRVAAAAAMLLAALAGGIWMLGPRARTNAPAQGSASLGAQAPGDERTVRSPSAPVVRVPASKTTPLPPGSKKAPSLAGQAGPRGAAAQTEPFESTAPGLELSETELAAIEATRSIAPALDEHAAGEEVARIRKPAADGGVMDAAKKDPKPSSPPVAARTEAAEAPALVGPLSMAVASGNPLSAATAAPLQATSITRPASAPTEAPGDEPGLEPPRGRAEQEGTAANATATAHLSLPPTVSVSPGEAARITVSVARRDLAGAARLAFHGLPQGVKADDATVPAGKTETVVLLSAARDAAPGSAQVKVDFTAGSERGEAETELTITRPPLAQALEQGHAELEQGAYDQAISRFDEALHLDPDSLDAHLQRGLAYRRQGRLREALADLEAAVQAAPRSAEAHLRRAQLHRELGQHGPALEDYSEAIRLRPETPVYVDRGTLLHDVGEYDQALADFDRAIRLDPQNATALYHRGLTRYVMGDNTGAVRDLTEVIRQDPGNRGAYQYRSGAFARLGQFSRAGSDHDEFVRLGQQPAPASGR